MKKRTLINGINNRKCKLTIAILICIFSMISVSAAVSEKSPWIASIEKNGESVVFADHDDSSTEGGWIQLSGGKEIQLPQPLSFTYCGPDCLEWEGATLKLNSGQGDNTKLTYTYPYSTHPFYTKNQKVKMDYNGPSAFKNKKVDIYLFKGLGANGMSINSENICLKEVLEKNSLSYTKTRATLDKHGDLTKPITFGSLEPYSYSILITLADDEDKILSATWFNVMNYGMEADALDNMEEGENLEVNMHLKNAPADKKVTYVAMLVKKEAYKADINLNTNGTKAGTDIFINGLNADDLYINTTDYSKNDLTKDIQTTIGEGNGTISIGEENQDTLSLTTFDLEPGDYLLFTGAYEPGKGIVGVDQKELNIYGTKTSPI